MKHYDSIPRVKDDGTLLNDDVWAFNKLDGQNFCVKYSPKTKTFENFGSRRCMVDDNNEQFGGAVKYFKENISETLKEIIIENSKKKGLFQGIEEITFFFEWYGENSFAGFHEDGDELKLSLIDVFLKKKGYIEPRDYYNVFCKDERILTPELIFQGRLTNDFITEIAENDWTKDDCKYPTVKEGVVCRRVSRLKGQRMPMCKFKTNWWLNKLHEKYTEEECKLLE